MTIAKGTFTVSMAPQDLHDKANTLSLTRLVLAKEYQGDLTATGHGEMIAAATDVPGSAGYVAMERVEGVLQGLEGSFVLQHSGTLVRGAPTLEVTVVPDSGTGDLAGLTGKLTIIIAEGKHFYALDYELQVTDA